MPTRKFSVLCLDDEPDHADLLRLALEANPALDVRFRVVTEPEKVLPSVEAETTDAVFLDYRLRAGTGDEVAKLLRDSRYIGLIVLVTAHGDEYAAATAIRSGADEYLIKSDITPARVAATLKTCEARYRLRVEQMWLARRAELVERIAREMVKSGDSELPAAAADELARLLAKESIDEMCRREEERAARYGRAFAVLRIRAQMEAFVDAALGVETVERAIAESCRVLDQSARIGDHEFVVLAPETDLRGALRLAERICDAVRERAFSQRSRHTEAVTLGVAASTEKCWRNLLQLAEDALVTVAPGNGGPIAISPESRRPSSPPRPRSRRRTRQIGARGDG